MKKYHLLLNIRNLLKNKLYTSINILGLIVGMTVSFLILKYVWFELSYDKFHQQGENIYRVRYDSYRNGELQFKCVGAIPALGPALKNDFSEVEEFCRLNPFYNGLTVSKDKNLYRLKNVYFADPSILNIFSFKSKSGDISNALNDVGSAVITESTAKKLFGDEDPLGKTFDAMEGNDGASLTVKAVMEDVPDNSHLKFDLLISYSTLVAFAGNEAETSWGWYDFYTYIKLTEGCDYKKLEAKFPGFIQKYTPNSERQYVLQPLHDIHLTSNYLQEMEPNGNKSFVIALGIIAIFVLIIAWANYINLSTVIAIERIKEIGIRKTNGAGKKHILIHFFTESLILNLLCFILSIGLYKLVMPYFILLSEKNLSIVNIDISVWFILLGIVIFGAILSGAVPAFLMASFNPAKAIKGLHSNEQKNLNARKILVGFQYVISIVLIICTFCIFKQINFIRKYNLGVDINRTLVVRGPGVVKNYDEYPGNFNFFKEEVLKHNGIKSLTAATNVPGNEIIWTNSINRLESDMKNATIYIAGIDHEYVTSYQLNLLKGRNFYNNINTDNRSVLLNKSAVKLLNFLNVEEAVNKQVRLAGRTYTIVGIIDDYHQRGLKENTAPIVFRYTPDATAFYSIKTTGNNLSEVISYVKEQYQKAFPGNTYDYFFLDSFFDQQYKTDVQFGKVISLFTILAIFICCLGLFGLALFSAKSRIKEIGIRKVNGAKTIEILALLNLDFINWIIVAFLVASPIAWYFVSRWLENFAYRTHISWWIYASAGIITFLVAIITMSVQSWQAARRNPVEALRYE